MNNGLSVVGHEGDNGGVPLVDDLGEGGCTRGHQDHTESIVESFDTLVGDSKEGLCSTFLGLLIGKIPDAIFDGELLVGVSDLWQDANLKVAHGEQKLRVIFRIDRHERVVPFDGSQGSR